MYEVTILIGDESDMMIVNPAFYFDSKEEMLSFVEICFKNSYEVKLKECPASE